MRAVVSGRVGLPGLSLSPRTNKEVRARAAESRQTAKQGVAKGARGGRRQGVRDAAALAAGATAGGPRWQTARNRRTGDPGLCVCAF